MKPVKRLVSRLVNEIWNECDNISIGKIRREDSDDVFTSLLMPLSDIVSTVDSLVEDKYSQS